MRGCGDYAPETQYPLPPISIYMNTLSVSDGSVLALYREFPSLCHDDSMPVRK